MGEKYWASHYGELAAHVGQLKSRFRDRCRELNADPSHVLSEAWREIVVRAVHESNWQEGLFVEMGRTQELAIFAFNKIDKLVGPHLDIDLIIEGHREHVVGLKESGASIEELATHNLSAAHSTVTWIARDLASRHSAALAACLKDLTASLSQGAIDLPPGVMESVQHGTKLVDDLLSDCTPHQSPLVSGYFTEGQVVEGLLNQDLDDLLRPMKEEYIHLLHRIVMMGIADPEKCGRFRDVPVHIGDPDVFFPLPSVVPEMMREFCEGFPTILPNTVEYDPVMIAAQTSYRFARVHPYSDGNGRISRLLMNLVLWGHHPPVYLKANKKGRHRYAQALDRANRGNLHPLASLIANSLVEIYERLLETMRRQS